MPRFRILILPCLVVFSSVQCGAQIELPNVSEIIRGFTVQPAPQQIRSVGNTWATIICGLPGDDEHRQRLIRALQQLVENGRESLGFDLRHTTLLVGDAPMQEELQIAPSRIASRDTIEEVFAALSQKVQPFDTHWIFILGHGNLQRRSSYFNIAGPDIDQHEFGQLVKQVPCRIKVIWAMQPTSGFWIRALADSNTVAISATQVGFEITGTEMPYALGDVLAGEASNQGLEDLDRDGRLSLFDLYLATCLEIAGRFTETDWLQTEHALLEDNGDGRGRELQRDYLPDAVSGVLSIKHQVIPLGRDGGLARLIPVKPAPASAAPEIDSEQDLEAESAE